MGPPQHTVTSLPLIIVRFTVTAIALICLATCRCPAADWELLPGRENDVELTVQGSTIDILTTGADPYVVGRWDRTRRSNDRVLQLEYFCSDPIDSFEGFFGPPISEASRIDLPTLPVAQGWQTYVVDLESILKRPLPKTANVFRFDLGSAAGNRLRIRNVQLRPLTESERRQMDTEDERRREKVARAARIHDYLEQSFDHKLDVRVERDSVIISIRQPDPAPFAHDPARYELSEFAPQHSIGDAPPPRCEDFQVGSSDRSLVLTVPRLVDGRDRLHSGWQIRLAETGSALTARHFASKIDPSSADYASERPRPKSQKGLSGFARRGPESDLLELGIHGVTINLVLNRFLSTTPGPGKTAIDVSGPDVYFDSRLLASHDQLIDFARQHDIVVSAIVLIPRSHRSADQTPLVHPQSDGGVYAMPDLDTERGVKIYGHLLDRIAQRYRNADHSPGAITNWIAHNEVDFHPVWTNMGRQPRAVFTETYYRSMRMIHNAAVAHNPHARVFASLTHHWAVPLDGSRGPEDGSWAQLAHEKSSRRCSATANWKGTLLGALPTIPIPRACLPRWHGKTTTSATISTLH